MITLTNGVLDDTARHLGHPERKPNELAIAAIRTARPVNPNTVLIGTVSTPDRYDDALVVYGPALKAFRASVDPGRFYTEHPLNADGVAHLENGAYLYRWGSHKGHRALVEAEPIRYWRDGDRDGTRDTWEKTRTGIIGAHLHSGGPGGSIGKWSAGCMVVYSDPPWLGVEWVSFVRMLEESGQNTFRVHLFDAVDLRRP